MGCVAGRPAVVRRTCPKNHQLKYLRSGKILHECSVCQKAIRSIEYLSCEECLYNVCIDCSKLTS
jgi:hypothetical protein